MVLMAPRDLATTAFLLSNLETRKLVLAFGPLHWLIPPFAWRAVPLKAGDTVRLVSGSGRSLAGIHNRLVWLEGGQRKKRPQSRQVRSWYSSMCLDSYFTLFYSKYNAKPLEGFQPESKVT